jgi:micrococcal nuclease
LQTRRKCLNFLFMRSIILIFLLLTSVFALPVNAAETLPQGDFTALTKTGTAKVTAVIDPYTVQLDDGRLVRLSSINAPDFSVEDAGPISVLALRLLRDMLNGKTVALYQTKKKDRGRLNRMGHHLAHLEVTTTKAWVQGTLLRLGLTRTNTAPNTPEMATQMYALEETARKESLGLWEDPAYAVLTPETASEHMDSFQIVEGVVQSAAIKNNRIYLNFGADWRTDFTVSIPPGYKRSFSKAGIDPLGWNNQPLRARGWIREYNGPYMEITHPESVQLLPLAPASSMVGSNR